MHWGVPEDLLRSLLPRQLTLDLYEGRAYVGLVPFAMEGVRPWWAPERLAFSFLETNVRTYVLHQGKPGVYFFSLDANSRLAVATARTVWGLPYYNATMSMGRSGDLVHYSSERHQQNASLDVRCRIGQPLGPSRPDTLDHFFLERYLLYVERAGQLHVGQVHHVPYPVQAATVESVSDGLVAAAGLPAVDSLPEYVHYAQGVDVEVFPLRRTDP